MTTPTTYLTTTTQTASCDVSQLTYGIQHEVILSPSTNCPSKVFQSEQVPMAYCTLPPIYIAWRPGPKVIDTCQSLPNYTAIATFTSGTFNPYLDIAGIFLGCSNDNTAFKAVIALCNSKMTIQDVTQDNSIFFHLPETYHVIMS
ncbi:hypothetical protein ACJMK2_013207 [Sinanodonta woodiana]|uniref:Uncharacterized protein n=1 Tax=Sinanodonta woodiana TaxID=1069815 RepID=A0ABD3UWS7_SINWO